MKWLWVLILAGNAFAADYGLPEYAKECEKALGPIPRFRCLDGQTIPVHDSDRGVEITDKTWLGNATRCDRPSLLRKDWVNRWGGYNPCVPFMRAAHVKGTGGFPTEWMWTCRRYFVRPKDDPKFDDINMIGHNPDTGATCFFVSRLNRTEPTKRRDLGLDGQNVPVIGSKESQGWWKSPAEMQVPAWRGGSERCTDCHDNDPFVHSPFIHQLKENGAPMVPSFPDGKYFALGSKYFNGPEWQVKHLVSPEAVSCTKCHRIGSTRSCDDWAGLAAGVASGQYQTKKYDKIAWMPAYHENWNLEKAVEERKAPAKKFTDAVRFINDCCSSPKNKKCKWEPVPR